MQFFLLSRPPSLKNNFFFNKPVDTSKKICSYEVVNFQDFETYEIHAEFCKAIANPKRLKIISLIGKKNITVGELAKAMDLSVSNISQHLKILKNYEIVKSEKEGHQVYYSLSDTRLIKTCDQIREIISDLYKKRKDIFNSTP